MVAFIPFAAPVANPRVASASEELDSVTVYEVNELGEPSAIRTHPFTGTITGIAFGFLNGDDWADLVVTTCDPDRIYVTYATAYGMFEGGLATYKVDGHPQGIAVGSVNVGDVYADIVVACRATDSVRVLLNAGDGTFPLSMQSTCYAGPEPRSVALADFNRDRRMDAAVANAVGGTIRVLRNSGILLRPFTPGFYQEFLVGGQPYEVAARDFNQEGYPDIVATTGDVDSDGEGKAVVLLNNGYGNFPDNLKTEYTLGWSSRSIATADFTSDGYPDLAVTGVRVKGSYQVGSNEYTESEESVFVLVNGGQENPGVFDDPIPHLVRPGTRGICAAELNDDGRPDVFTGYGGRLADSQKFVSVLLGSDDVPLITASTLTYPSWSFSIEIGDVDGDLLPDVLMAALDTDEVVAFLGDGLGGFPTMAVVETGPSPRGVEAALLNDDEYTDLVVACEGRSDGAGCVQVHYGSGLGEWNGPVLSLEVGYRPIEIEVADFDGDGDMDIAAVAERNVAPGDQPSGACILWGDEASPFSDSKIFPRVWDPAGARDFVHLRAADIDGDEHVDLTVVESIEDPGQARNSVVTIWGPISDSSNTLSSFCPSLEHPGVASVDFADLNGDDLLDAAVSAAGGNSGVLIYLAQQDRERAVSFQEPPTFECGTLDAVYRARVTDVDGDGYADVMAPVHYDSYNVTLFRGLGGGLFDIGDPHHYGCAHWPNAVAIGELNPLADSTQDAVVVHEAGVSGVLGNIVVYFGQTIGVREVFAPARSHHSGSGPRFLAAPNPFRSSTIISFSMPVGGGAVRVAIYDAAGRCVRTLLDQCLPAGDHDVVWDGRNDAGVEVASGVYFCRVVAGKEASSRKIAVMR